MNQKNQIKNQNKSFEIKKIIDNISNSTQTIVEKINTYNNKNKYLVMLENNVFNTMNNNLKEDITTFIQNIIKQDLLIIFETFSWDELE